MKKGLFFLLLLLVLISIGYIKIYPLRQRNNTDQNGLLEKTYESPSRAFTFTYKSPFIVREGEHPDFQQGSFLQHHGSADYSAPVSVVALIPRGSYSGTNFSGAWLAVAQDEVIANEENCRYLEFGGKITRMLYTQKIQGITWFRDIANGAAAGTRVDSQVYHVLHNQVCFEVTLNLATSNIDNYSRGTIKAVDEAEVWRRLNEVFDTFQFIK